MKQDYNIRQLISYSERNSVKEIYDITLSE